MGKDINSSPLNQTELLTEIDSILSEFKDDKSYPVLIGIFRLFKKHNYESQPRKYIIKTLQNEYKKYPKKFIRRDGEYIEGNKTFYDTVIQSFYRGKCFKGKLIIEIVPERAIIYLRTLVKRRNNNIINGYPFINKKKNNEKKNNSKEECIILDSNESMVKNSNISMFDIQNSSFFSLNCSNFEEYNNNRDVKFDTVNAITVSDFDTVKENDKSNDLSKLDYSIEI